jgi:microcin C transport system substrate-binding protein
MGVRDKVVDELVDLVISAPDRQSLITRTHALDRVLLFGYYVIPHYHNRTFRVAYWTKLQHPALMPKYDVALEAWWIDTKSEQTVEARKNEVVKQGEAAKQ